jgi:hypothetical protein
MRVDGIASLPTWMNYGISISIFRGVPTNFGYSDFYAPVLPRRVLPSSCL